MAAPDAVRCRHELTGLVLQRRERELVIFGVPVLDIADCALVLLDQGGHAIIAFSGNARWPGHAGALAHLVFEFRADRAEMLRENEICSAAIRTFTRP